MSLDAVLKEPLSLTIGFPLVPFLNGVVYSLVYNRKKHLFIWKVKLLLIFLRSK